MNYTELFDGIDELLESGELIVSDGKLYSAVDELDEGIIGGLIKKVQAHNDKKTQTAISKASLNTRDADDPKTQKINAKVAKAQEKLNNMAYSGNAKKIKRATNIMKDVNKTTDTVAKFTKEQDAHNNNAAAVRNNISNVKANAKFGGEKTLADAKYNDTSKKGLAVEKNKATIDGEAKEKAAAEAKKAKGAAKPAPATAGGTLEESVLVFDMPETLMLAESDNYEYFLEQVLAYNGYKVTENNVNVLHAALENGHAVIE